MSLAEEFVKGEVLTDSRGKGSLHQIPRKFNGYGKKQREIKTALSVMSGPPLERGRMCSSVRIAFFP